LANDLVEQCGAKIWIDEDGQANVEIQGLEFYLNSWEELNILCEIFAQGIYNVQLDEPFIFIDIGMNVAMTTLFLAANQKVAEIYAYEPFAETFQSGLRNIERNPRFAAKIHAFNYGISTRAEELVVDYFTEFKGSVGMKGIPGRVLNDKLRQKIRKEKVSLRAVDEILSEISLKHPGRKLITKIDCEGSETEIVRLLNQKNLLAEFEVIMLEWHSSGPEELARILVENKFCCFSFDPFRKDIGMIYAVRGH
jgi:FkbM family methyltransferase